MEQEKPRARRRAKAHSTPEADDRFRVVVEDGDRSSKLPDAPSAPITVDDLNIAPPYVGPTTVRSNDVVPAGVPSNDLSRGQPVSPVSVVADGAGAFNLAPPVTVPAAVPDNKRRGNLLLMVIPVVVIAAGIVGFLMFGSSKSTDTPASPVATGAGAEVPADVKPPPATSAAPSADPTQQEPDTQTAPPEPSGSSRKRTRKTPPTGQPPADSTTNPKGGRRSPVIF